jgi:hypothetical protein
MSDTRKSPSHPGVSHTHFLKGSSVFKSAPGLGRKMAHCTCLAALACGASLAKASPLDFSFQATIPEAEYQTLVTPIVTPMRYMFFAPAAPTGLAGIEIGLGATGSALPEKAKTVAEAFLEEGSDLPPFIAVPRLSVQKGIPFGIDIGVNLAVVPSTDLLLWGGALQWAPLDGPFPVPSAALRIGYTQLSGLDTLDASATNAEGIVSIGLPPGVNLLKPYAGLGMAWYTASSSFSYTDTFTETLVSASAETSWDDFYGILGLQISVFPFVSLTAEGQIGSEQTLYSAKLSVGL